MRSVFSECMRERERDSDTQREREREQKHKREQEIRGRGEGQDKEVKRENVKGYNMGTKYTRKGSRNQDLPILPIPC